MSDANDLERNQRKLACEILLCPLCKTEILIEKGGNFFCRNTGCERSEKGFLIVNGKPVLIDFDRSVVSASAFTGNIGKSIVHRREANLGKYARKIFQGKSRVTRANVQVLIGRIKLIKDPKILVVGGGEIGSGLEDFYKLFHNNIVAFDIYNSEWVDFIADAHLIPVKTAYFDLVIIQAVLEHVLNPQQVVSEISRVLQIGGVVYAETPFMQQVHEGPYDFTRFTESGHRYLFKQYKLVSSGYNSGVGTSLIWSLGAFFSGLFRSKYGGRIARILFFWLRFFDKVIPLTFNIDGACGVYFMGIRSAAAVISDKEIIDHYRGNQRVANKP